MFFFAIISYIAGIIFGLSCIFSKRVIFLFQKPGLHGALSAIRLITASVFLYFMLKSTPITPIILVTSFLAGYWTIVITYKEIYHGKS